MTVEEMAEAIGRAHGASLDALARALWAAVACGECSDENAAQLVEAIEARRASTHAARATFGVVSFSDKGVFAKSGGNLLAGQVLSSPVSGSARGITISLIPLHRYQRPPIRSEAIERRRRLAASGPMPPALAARFTTGELAVLRIVADEHQARQVCALCLDAIAARAGVSRTLAKGAIRQARRLGMLEVRERRRAGAKSLPNVVRVVDREWLAWMKRSPEKRKPGVLKSEETTSHRGVLRKSEDSAQPKTRPSRIGGRNSPTTDTKVLTMGTTRPAETAQRVAERDETGRKGVA